MRRGGVRLEVRSRPPQGWLSAHELAPAALHATWSATHLLTHGACGAARPRRSSMASSTTCFSSVSPRLPEPGGPQLAPFRLSCSLLAAPCGAGPLITPLCGRGGASLLSLQASSKRRLRRCRRCADLLCCERWPLHSPLAPRASCCAGGQGGAGGPAAAAAAAPRGAAGGGARGGGAGRRPQVLV